MTTDPVHNLRYRIRAVLSVNDETSYATTSFLHRQKLVLRQVTATCCRINNLHW